MIIEFRDQNRFFGPSCCFHRKKTAQRSAPGPLGDFCQQQVADLSYYLFLLLSLFFPFLFITSFFWFSCLFFSFSFVMSFIFCLFRLLFPVKITACATKSPFNQVFKEIHFKMNPRKSTFRQIFDTQNKNFLSFPFSNFGSLVLAPLGHSTMPSGLRPSGMAGCPRRS